MWRLSWGVDCCGHGIESGDLVCKVLGWGYVFCCLGVVLCCLVQRSAMFSDLCLCGLCMLSVQIREEARKQQEELERILEENKKRVEAAQAAAAAAVAVGQPGGQAGPSGVAAGSAGGSRATSAANPLLQRSSVRPGGGMILVE